MQKKHCLIFCRRFLQELPVTPHRNSPAAYSQWALNVEGYDSVAFSLFSVAGPYYGSDSVDIQKKYSTMIAQLESKEKGEPAG